MIVAIWNYAHNHWQDNVIASAIWAVPAYLYGRFHLKKFHRKLDKIHRHMGIKED